MENENLINKHNAKSIVAFTVIIVLFLGLLFITFSYFNSPKKKLVDGINKFYNVLVNRETNKEVNNILENNIVGLRGEAKINLSGSSMDETLRLFDNTIIKYNYIEDKENKKASLGLNSSINNEKLIEMYGLIKDNKIYFNLKNLINKFYFIDYTFNELLQVENIEDIEYVLEILKDTLIENIDNDSFSKYKEIIKINGKDEKVNKISFKFTDKFILDIIAEFVNKIKDDEKAINILVEYTKTTKEEILKQLNSFIDSSKNVTTNETYMFNIYVKDYMTQIKYSLEMDATEISYSNYNNVKEFSVSLNGVNYLNIKLENNEKISGMIAMMPITGTYKNNRLDLTLSYMNTNINLNISGNNEIKSDEINSNVKIEVKVSQLNKENLKLVIDSKNTISKVDKINELNISSSSSFESISEKDQNIIINKLIEMPIFKQIMLLQNNIGLEESVISF